MANEVTSLNERLATLAHSFHGRRVLVVGDLLADQFLFGEISRVSREAPVLILRHERTETVAGGAANCVMNLASLGARASIVGVVGEDETGRALVEKLKAAGVDCGGVISSPALRTTTKVRVLAGHAHSPRQQVIRVDYESAPLADAAVEAELVRLVREKEAESDAIIVSDYNYGVASTGVIAHLREVAGAGTRPVLVDSRFRLREFVGFTSATPNEDEVEQVVRERLAGDAALEEWGARLRRELSFRALLITRGKEGATLVEEGREPLHIRAVGSHDAVDVTGAGDTVIATYALALASGASYTDAAHLANHAGGVVVMKRGTACVTPQELLGSLAQGGD